MGKQIRKSLDLRPRINTKDSITSGTAPKKNVDSLVGFFHGPTNGFDRLKLYDSAMPSSPLKHHLRGALTSIGAAVRCSLSVA